MKERDDSGLGVAEHPDGSFLDDPTIAVPREPVPVLACSAQRDRSISLSTDEEVVGAAGLT